MQTSDRERAQAALASIDPGVERLEWIRILASAKAAGIDFETVDKWSSQAQNYKGSKDVWAAWKTLKPEGGITAGTLFYKAHKFDQREFLRREQWARNNESPFEGKSNRKNYDPLTVWNQCTSSIPDHPYVLRKNGTADGVRVYPQDGAPLFINGLDVRGWLAVPVYKINAGLLAIQFIAPDEPKNNDSKRPDKLFLGRLEDGVFIVGEIQSDGMAYVVEGVGTAWASWKASGHASVVTFGWGRMHKVASLLKLHYPNLRLVLLPDTGKEQGAKEIAASLSDCGWVALPLGWPSNSDAADYALKHGFDALEELLGTNAEYPVKSNSRYRLQSAKELLGLPPVRWRIKGVLPQNGIGAVYGPSTTGKSFVAIDLAMAVASGDAWFGRKVKAAPVTYVCLEGAEGLRLRLEAWKHFHMRELPSRLQFFTLDDFSLLKPADVMDLAEIICEKMGVGGLVVIDTLAQAAPGMDENSGADMSLALSACKKLQSILQGLVLLVHHTGKDGSRGMRGHSSLFAAMDAVLEVVRDGDRRGWRVAKAKDGRDGVESYFRLQVIDLGVDEDGDPITSCIVRPDESPEASIRKVRLPKGGNQRIVYDTLNELLRISPYRGQGGAPNDRPCIRIDDLIQTSGERLACDQKRRTERARQAITGLVSSGIAELRGEWVWLL